MDNQFESWYKPLSKWECITDRTFDALDIIYENGIVYPSRKNVFRAFRECSYESCRVVMIFQDPYSKGNIATGIATAVEGKPIPGSLQVIFKELEIEYGKCTVDPSLLSWSKQGVLLLNAALTVSIGEPSSHLKMWSKWTSKFITGLSTDKSLVWVLFGREIQKYKPLIKRGEVLCVPHPAAELYSGNAGFLNSGIFKNINTHLNKIIKWNE